MIDVVLIMGREPVKLRGKVKKNATKIKRAKIKRNKRKKIITPDELSEDQCCCTPHVHPLLTGDPTAKKNRLTYRNVYWNCVHQKAIPTESGIDINNHAMTPAEETLLTPMVRSKCMAYISAQLSDIVPDPVALAQRYEMEIYCSTPSVTRGKQCRYFYNKTRIAYRMNIESMMHLFLCLKNRPDLHDSYRELKDSNIKAVKVFLLNELQPKSEEHTEQTTTTNDIEKFEEDTGDYVDEFMNQDRADEFEMRCEMCGCHNLVSLQRQTRGADEAMTGFVRCRQCSHRWRL
jgi:DNA-directed RNA polymerase subunit M/transcription elongation factor TFIIS